MIAIIFSKDRPLQLDATIRSLAARCRDLHLLSLHVICMASAQLFADGYHQLRRELNGSVDVNWMAENDFKENVMSLLQPDDHVLWLVDDNLFFADFSVAQARDALQKDSEAIGFSLRLGTNTSYCYPLDAPQKLPDFSEISPGTLAYCWPNADYDFGYPLEVSSSIYRTNDLIPLLRGFHFNNPNSLEEGMAQRAVLYRESHPRLLCFEKSVTFCNPVNKVQSVCSGNRAGSCEQFSAEQLVRRFLSGYRIDLAVPEGFEPNACHQERDLALILPKSKTPTVSVVIPCYNQAEFLSDAVNSVIAQTFTDWECLIVNDGSPDTTSEVASAIIVQHPHLPIYLYEKQNGGLADARNHGITRSKGRYILPLDSDDILHPDMLAKTVAVLEKQPEVAIVYTDLFHFGAVENHVVAGEYDFPTLKYANQLNYCSLYRREVWEQVGGYNTNMKWGYEDWDFWIGAGKRGFFARHLPEELLFYRVKHESMYTKALEHDAELKAQIVQNHPALYAEEERAWARKVLTPHRPLVSVIVPTHNRPKMLKEALQSILDQTFRDFEIIVVNDAGQDVSEGVAAFQSPAIVYLSHDRNKGLAAARNTGIRTARGKYIAYLDDDDLFYPEHLETLVTALQENEVKVAYTNAFRAHQYLQGERYVTYYKDIPYSFDFDYERILYENYIPVLCFMHEKTCLDTCGMFDESFRRLEDWELWLRMSRHFAMLHIGSLTCEFSYRPDGSSMVSSSLAKFLDSTRSLFEKHHVSSESPIYAKRQTQIFTLRYDTEKQLVDTISSAGVLAFEDFLASSLYSSLTADGVPQEMIASAFYHCQSTLSTNASDTEGFLLRALATDPDNHSARCTLCTLLTKQNRLDEVAPHLQYLREVNPACDIINEIATALRGGPSKTEPAFPRRSKINLAVYSFDLPEQACSQLRFLGARGQLPEDVDILWGTYFDPQKGNFTIFQELAAQADIIVFARFFPRKETSSFIESVFALGKPVVYDLDDLLTELPDENPFKRNGDEARPFIENVMKRVDLITISNTQLQQEIHVHNRKTVVLGNLLDQTLWGQALPPRSSTSDIVIGYAGGFTHGEDLRILDEVLPAIASNFGSRVRFRFIGCISDKLRSLPNCEFIEAEPNYGSYAMKLRHAGFDIALAPLCDNRFNRCKSNIKWLEYAACGCAGIFSDLPPYECVDHGRTGLLVRNTPEQWYEAISFLIENPSTRTAIGSNARTEVLSHHTLANNLHWLDAYRSLVHTQQPTPLKTVNTAPVSVVIPVYNQLALTMQCLQTLKEKTPENSLEVIVVDNASSDGTNEYLKNAPLNIKVITNTSNLGFARACNQGASAASGEYILFLNNDIEVLPNWLDPLLSRIASDQSIAAVGSKLLFPDGTIQHAGVMIIEDHKNKELLAPFHRHYKQPSETRKANISKPCQALTAACLLVRREAFYEVGGYCEEYWNGYEDVDLCFKLGQKGWKLIYEPTSVLIHHESKSGKERFIRQKENIALLHKKWLGKIKPDVYVDEQDRWYSLTDEIYGTPLCTIIIPVYNKLAFTSQCLEAVLADPFVSRQEIIVVDNGSTDATSAYLQELEGHIKVIKNDENRGFSIACNQGAGAATGDYLVFLNNDTIPEPGWLQALIRGAQADGADIVGAKLLYPDRTVQHAGVAVNSKWGPYHIFNGLKETDPAVCKKRFLQIVTGACMLIKATLFRDLGGFDETYRNGFEDVDLCMKAVTAGAKVLYTPESVVIHFESISDGRQLHTRENGALFISRWGNKLQIDDEEIYRSEGISVVREANGQVFIERNGTP